LGRGPGGMPRRADFFEVTDRASYTHTHTHTHTHTYTHTHTHIAYFTYLQALMSGYIIYDTWQIMNRYTPDDWYRSLNPKPKP
jgi:hypothetical protein